MVTHVAFEEGLNYESGTFVTASSLETSLFLVRHPFQRGFNQTMDMELKITNYKYNNMVLQSPIGVETASFDICLKLFVVLILQFAGFQLKPHIRSFPDTQCAVAELYCFFCYRMLIIFLNVKPFDHISQGGL